MLQTLRVSIEHETRSVSMCFTLDWSTMKQSSHWLSVKTERWATSTHQTQLSLSITEALLSLDQLCICINLSLLPWWRRLTEFKDIRFNILIQRPPPLPPTSHEAPTSHFFQQIWFIPAICSLITWRLFLSFISVSGSRSLLHLICHFYQPQLIQLLWNL